MTHHDEEHRDEGEGTKGESPRTSEEQDHPEAERLQTPREEAGMAPHQREDPPQAEGDRDESAEE